MADKRSAPPDPAGVLVVDKPSGPTSHDVVARVRRHLKVKRAGHTGTLDPLARGVLVVCVGEATKLAGYLTHAEKDYETTVRLGQATDTHDSTGEVVESHEVDVTREQVEEVLEQFRGQIAQVPPMYSALKKGGQRLYKLARKGEVVEREPRVVQVNKLELTRFEPPELDLSVTCGKGTYVRTLAHDIGAALGCGAHLSALTRTRVGNLTLDDAVALDAIVEAKTPEAVEAIRERMIPMSEAMDDHPGVRLDRRMIAGIRQGRALKPGDVAQVGGAGLRTGQLVRLLDEADRLVALGEVKSHGLQPVRVFQSVIPREPAPQGGSEAGPQAGSEAGSQAGSEAAPQAGSDTDSRSRAESELQAGRAPGSKPAPERDPESDA